MTQTSPTTDPGKKYPLVTPEVAKMFGLPEHATVPSTAVPSQGADPTGKEGFAPVAGNLYIKEAPVDLSQNVASGKKIPEQPVLPARLEAAPRDGAGGAKILNALKNLTPYVAVFSAALFVYFYFFSGSGINFGGLAKIPVPQTAKQSSLAQLESQNLAGYQAWIGQFYYDISDYKIIDPEADNSGNGLSNFQKYLLNLNPKSYDTIGLGMSDSDALQAGINPLTGAALTDDQKNIIAKYFDFEVIANRQTLAQLQKKSQVAGAHTGYGSFGFGAPSAEAASLPNGIPQAAGNNPVYQPAYQIPPLNPVPVRQPAVPPAGQSGGSDLDINTGIPGQLVIPSLKISAPLIWSSDPKNFDKDLQGGVIHYPGTALPGQIGTTYISGHSSNYAWAKGKFNHVFTYLNNLADNTSFGITVTTRDGKTHIFHYVVAGRQQYNPNDDAQFKNSAQSVVALSTCWPVGSTKYRLVVFGQLTQIENN